MMYVSHDRCRKPCKHGVSRRRHALTLFEMMVVLLIIVVLLAVSLPAFQSMLFETRSTVAGDLIQGRLADTRALAMEQGRTYRFGFSLGSGWFQVAAEDDPVWDSMTMAELDEGLILRGELPKDILFVSGDGSPSSGAGGWEAGVVYNPDGSARNDASIFFGKEGGQSFRVEVRGLTGAVRQLDRRGNGEGNEP